MAMETVGSNKQASGARCRRPLERPCGKPIDGATLRAGGVLDESMHFHFKPTWVF
jgi:hypothetical protein